MAKLKKQSELTDNKTANINILPLWLVAAFFAAYTFDYFSANIILNVAAFTVAYVFASWWFSPDLDIATWETGVDSFIPGRHSFPFTPAIKGLNALGLRVVANTLGSIHKPLNYAWRGFWLPFGAMFTHRGAVHLPFYGVLLRVTYVYSVFWLIYAITAFLSGYNVTSYVDGYILMAALFSTPVGASVLAGFIISDITHSAVDLKDSIAKGTRFCSIQNRPGMIKEFFQSIRR